MSLLVLILVIAGAGLLLYLINRYVPMEAGIKKLLNIVVIILLIIMILKVSGIWGWLAGVRV